jgi:glycyl-tRNA synthetase alpha subunit
LQVILKPPPENVQELYLDSLRAIGIDLRQHDIKFEEDNWEAPTLSAWGVGWQVMLDGLEITQFTYFQQCGGVDLFPISAELTYGLERIAAFLQDVDSIYDIVWARDPDTGHPTTYGDVRLADELQFSMYNFDLAGVEKTWKHFELYESECLALLNINFGWAEKDDSTVEWSWPSFGVRITSGKSVCVPEGRGRTAELQAGKMCEFTPVLDEATLEVTFVEGSPKQQLGHLTLSRRPLPVGISSHGSRGLFGVPNPSPAALLPAYDLCLKCSHMFNILDARGAISVTERVGVIARVRALAVGIAKAWVHQQHPTEDKTESANQGAKPVAKERKPKLAPVGS